MSNQKWLATFLSISLGALFLFYGFRIIGHQYMYDNERATWQAKSEMIDTLKPADYDAIIIGTSRGLAVNPEYFKEHYDLDVINLSAGGANAVSIYYFLERILEHGKPNKLLIELNPSTLSSIDSLIDTTLGERFIRFVATKEEVAELAIYNPSAQTKYNNIRRFPYAEWFNKNILTLIEGIRFRQDTGMNDRDMIDLLKANGGFFLFGWHTYQFNEINRVVPDHEVAGYSQFVADHTHEIPELTTIYFAKLLDKLEETDIDYQFFFAPMPLGRAEFTNLGFGKMTEVFGRIDPEHIHPEIMLLDEQLFSDASHVNYQGSIQFNQFIYERVLNDHSFDNHTLYPMNFN